jgi:hypothetical protein
MPQLTRKRIAIAGASAVALLTVGVLVGGRAWVRGQDYLEQGSLSRLPVQARVVPVDLPTPGEPEEIAVVPYRDGGRTFYGFSVRNDGPLSVTVTEVERPAAPDDSYALFRPVEVRMAREDFGTEADVPFRPFTLGSGQERYLEVIGKFEDCEHHLPGSSNGTSSQQVRFEVLGQSLSADVALPAEIEWRYGRDARCPRRVRSQVPNP